MDLLHTLQDARDGNKHAEEELFRTLSVRFRLIAYRMLRDSEAAQDIAQEAAMDVLKAYRDLDVRESFAAWARIVVRNRALKYLESRKRQASLAANLVDSYPSDSGEQGNWEWQRRLLDCLKELSRNDIRYGRIVNLKHQGYSVEEICEKLVIRANHAYVILHRARQALRACLDNGRSS